jgi:hypothetical protein
VAGLPGRPARLPTASPAPTGPHGAVPHHEAHLGEARAGREPFSGSSVHQEARAGPSVGGPGGPGSRATGCWGTTGTLHGVPSRTAGPEDPLIPGRARWTDWLALVAGILVLAGGGWLLVHALQPESNGDPTLTRIDCGDSGRPEGSIPGYSWCPRGTPPPEIAALLKEESEYLRTGPPTPGRARQPARPVRRWPWRTPATPPAGVRL